MCPANKKAFFPPHPVCLNLSVSSACLGLSLSLKWMSRWGLPHSTRGGKPRRGDKPVRQVRGQVSVINQDKGN